MMREEARWFGQRLAEMNPADVFPMCNVGSSTEAFRTRIQPWVDEYVFAPLREQNRVIRHLDVKPMPGVDIVGDLSDPAFLEQLSQMNFRSFLCSNLLEHVQDHKGLCQKLNALVAHGGHFFVSCPFRYPYHPDPIDTMFRPTTDDLTRLFPGTRVRCAATIRGGRYLSADWREPIRTLLVLARCAMPFYRPTNWWRSGGYLPWLFHRTSATCVVLQKD
jgi:hypothetical protein